jgi:hypothetical protein
MKATKKGKTCPACGKRPAAEFGICKTCQPWCLVSPLGEVVDFRTGEAWPVPELQALLG